MVADNTNLVKGRTRPVIGPKLRRLLGLVFLLVALLIVNSTYLAAITLLEHVTAEIHQDYFYLSMFLVHLVLGIALAIGIVWALLSH